MDFPANKLLFCALALAALALPASAAGESVVPPENSAATQYTEAIPTGGGQKDAGGSGNGKKRSPSSVLGSKKAKKLEAQGPQGHAAAQTAAETAPTTVRATSEVVPAPSEPAPQHAGSHEGSKPPKRSNGGRSEVPNARSPQTQPVAQPPRLDMSGGSSGFGEVLGQATGASSSGALGLLLPLLVLATLIWGLLYGLRRRRPAA
ncbi:MAG TPA: hypothetical protein VJ989_03955 [Solirubrobacterales bacterium]|nr:hypothetical protein [Solirubrobacterales bacterium]